MHTAHSNNNIFLFPSTYNNNNNNRLVCPLVYASNPIPVVHMLYRRQNRCMRLPQWHFTRLEYCIIFHCTLPSSNKITRNRKIIYLYVWNIGNMMIIILVWSFLAHNMHLRLLYSYIYFIMLQNLCAIDKDLRVCTM